MRLSTATSLLVSVPDRETQAWLETEYSSLVRTAIVGLKLPVSKIVYEARPAKGVHNQALAAVEISATRIAEPAY